MESPSLMDKIDESKMAQHEDGGSDKVDQVMMLIAQLSDEERSMVMDHLMEQEHEGNKPGVKLVIGVGKSKEGE